VAAIEEMALEILRDSPCRLLPLGRKETSSPGRPQQGRACFLIYNRGREK
jgi:hypothetical protein